MKSRILLLLAILLGGVGPSCCFGGSNADSEQLWKLIQARTAAEDEALRSEDVKYAVDCKLEHPVIPGDRIARQKQQVRFVRAGDKYLVECNIEFETRGSGPKMPPQSVTVGFNGQSAFRRESRFAQVVMVGASQVVRQMPCASPRAFTSVISPTTLKQDLDSGTFHLESASQSIESGHSVVTLKFSCPSTGYTGEFCYDLDRGCLVLREREWTKGGSLAQEFEMKKIAEITGADGKKVFYPGDGGNESFQQYDSRTGGS
jgi:hypothetical protein